jgi:predicted RNase H-like HicB family nuclease
MTNNFAKNGSSNLSKFNYSALVEKREGGYQASVWGLPDYSVFETTREDALQRLHQLVGTHLKNVEIVTQEIDIPNPENPWIKYAGMYKDESLFDEVIAYTEDYRQELDTEQNFVEE